MNQLLLALRHGAPWGAELDYVLVSPAGTMVVQGAAAPAMLPAADQAILLLPSQALSWHACALPQLPRGSSEQKHQALLAGVLEEQVLDDPSQLHMVACRSLESPSTAPGQTWVAVCDKAWLGQWVRGLNDAGVPLAKIVPMTFPSSVVQVHVSGSTTSPWLEFAHADGVSVLPLQHASLLPSLWPLAVEPSAEPAVAGIAEASLGQAARMLSLAQRALDANAAAAQQGLDLARGDLALSGQARFVQRAKSALQALAFAPAWRPARLGLALLVLAHVVGLNLWAWKADQHLQAQRSQMQQLLRNSFSQVKWVVDAPLQMQRELALLRQAQGQLSGRDFESLFSRFSSVAQWQTPPSQIEFVSGELRLKGLAFSMAQLDALKPPLQEAGLDVRLNDRLLTVTHRESSPLPPPPATRSGGTP
jgi:general secretion pathway protein L